MACGSDACKKEPVNSACPMRAPQARNPSRHSTKGSRNQYVRNWASYSQGPAAAPLGQPSRRLFIARHKNSRTTPGPSPCSPWKETASFFVSSAFSAPRALTTASQSAAGSRGTRNFNAERRRLSSPNTASFTSCCRQRCRKPMGTNAPWARNTANSLDTQNELSSRTMRPGSEVSAEQFFFHLFRSASASHLSMAPSTKRSSGMRGPRRQSSPKRISLPGRRFEACSSCKKPMMCQNSASRVKSQSAPSCTCTTFASATSATACTSCSNIVTGHSNAKTLISSSRSSRESIESINVETCPVNSADHLALSMFLPAKSSVKLLWHLRQKSTSQPSAVQLYQTRPWIGRSQLSQARLVWYATFPVSVRNRSRRHALSCFSSCGCGMTQRPRWSRGREPDNSGRAAERAAGSQASTEPRLPELADALLLLDSALQLLLLSLRRRTGRSHGSADSFRATLSASESADRTEVRTASSARLLTSV
mmetsp:Transcript_150235/g.273538  ORF Transcript_150235/g.273538 Transcript_150235/m.273538 type:complete len:480 (-) Transcript_150235:379-1818(-)